MKQCLYYHLQASTGQAISIWTEKKRQNKKRNLNQHATYGNYEDMKSRHLADEQNASLRNDKSQLKQYITHRISNLQAQFLKDKLHSLTSGRERSTDFLNTNSDMLTAARDQRAVMLTARWSSSCRNFTLCSGDRSFSVTTSMCITALTITGAGKQRPPRFSASTRLSSSVVYSALLSRTRFILHSSHFSVFVAAWAQ